MNDQPIPSNEKVKIKALECLLDTLDAAVAGSLVIMAHAGGAGLETQALIAGLFAADRVKKYLNGKNNPVKPAAE